jgi:hypothetical protein
VGTGTLAYEKIKVVRPRSLKVNISAYGSKYIYALQNLEGKLKLKQHTTFFSKSGTDKSTGFETETTHRIFFQEGGTDK